MPIHSRHPLSDGDRIQAGRLDLRLILPGIATVNPIPIFPGNAQHRGDREEQQDSFGFSDLNDQALLDRGGW